MQPTLRPFGNSDLVDHLTEPRELISAITFSIGQHDLKVEVFHDVVEPFKFHYNLYERKVVTKKGTEESLEAWVIESNFPFDVAESADEALATAIRWTKDYYPKKA